MFYFKRLAQLIFPVLIICLLLGGALGCEAPEEEPINDEEVVNDEEEAVIDTEQWKNPDEKTGLIEDFEELEYVWTRVEDGEETDSIVVGYRDEGSETVNGVDTTKAVFSIDGDEITVWVDEDGDAVQAEVEGQVVPGEFADQALGALEQAVFVPFVAVDSHEVSHVLSDVTVEGYDWSVVATDTEQFNGLEAEVTTVEVTVSPPAVPENKGGTLIWSIGDFGDFQMITGWNFVEPPGADDLSFTLEVTKVVPR